MAGQERTTTVGQLPTPETEDARVPTVLTTVVWVLWVASCGALAAHVWTGESWRMAGLVSVDGLTVVLWAAVTFFSGLVHSYSRRYMAGNRALDRFFGRVFAFTLVVMVLVAADNLLVFGLAWLAMGLVMADLVGHVEGWPQAQAAASLGRRYFLASSALLAAALVTLWVYTGAATVSGVASAGVSSSPVVLFAAGLLLLAAMVQSALVPFHTWLLSSMTAPTPASALMHAGFVNAGGVLLVRFAPVVTVEPGFMLVVALVGATSALLGKLLKSVQVDVKTRLGCSTTGQMGFMIMQAGLGFFGAAITHLVLHGCYKAYLFLSAGEEVEHTSPETTHGTGGTGGVGPVGLAVTAVTALAGGVLFAGLTGKGTTLDGGLVLTGLVVLTTMHATQHTLRRRSLPATYRYGAVPLVFLPAIAVYAVVYVGVVSVMEGVPVVTAPAELTVAHGVVAAGFLGAYVAIETGVYRYSDRLYVALVNATRPPSGTALTSTEEYNEY
jgi:NAD(P)H-quinone oxidoreductase subunit 5